MTDSFQSRLDQLEMLYSEQDYLIQTLNSLVTQQDLEISQLTLNLEQMRLQLQSLRGELGDDIDTGIEQPPHY